MTCRPLYTTVSYGYHSYCHHGYSNHGYNHHGYSDWCPICSHSLSLCAASSCDQRGVLSFLLSSGSDPSIRDSDGCTAGEVAGDQATRDLFTQN